jgi:histidinol phosphatase-like enzyme
MKKKTNMIKPYTHQTNVIRRKYYIDKRCTNMGGSKNVKEPNEKNVLYQRTKVKKLGTPKNEKAEKT